MSSGEYQTGLGDSSVHQNGINDDITTTVNAMENNGLLHVSTTNESSDTTNANGSSANSLVIDSVSNGSNVPLQKPTTLGNLNGEAHLLNSARHPLGAGSDVSTNSGAEESYWGDENSNRLLAASTNWDETSGDLKQQKVAAPLRVDTNSVDDYTGLSSSLEDHGTTYFPPLAFTPSDLPPTPNSQIDGGGFSTLDFAPHTTPYLSPHQAAAVGFPFYQAISPDYPPWAHASAAFDFGQTLASPVDANSLKLFEQNFSNLNFLGATSPLTAIDLANYQAVASQSVYPPGKNKSFATMTGQPIMGSNSPSNRGFHKSKQRATAGNGHPGFMGAQSGGPMYNQNMNSFYNRPSQHPMLDIGTWDYSEEISPSNKTLTRSGKIVPTPSEKENEVLRQLRQANEYNPVEFNCSPKEAKFFVIKSYSEDDIHRSIKYNIWCSTDRGNKKLNEAYGRIQGKGPLYLMFSVNGSGHFCGVAEMKSPVNFDTHRKVWSQSKWKGSFDVTWIFVKDVPNSNLRHIRLENNENKPVTNSRDTQEIPFEKGKLILKVFHKYEHATSLFDDFSHYENREKEISDQHSSVSETSQRSSYSQNSSIPHYSGSRPAPLELSAFVPSATTTSRTSNSSGAQASNQLNNLRPSSSDLNPANSTGEMNGSVMLQMGSSNANGNSS